MCVSTVYEFGDALLLGELFEPIASERHQAIDLLRGSFEIFQAKGVNGHHGDA